MIFWSYFSRLKLFTKVHLIQSLGLTFRDKTVDGHPDKVENREAITLSEFTDRVYYNAPDTCVLNGMHGGKGEMSCKEFYGRKIMNKRF